MIEAPIHDLRVAAYEVPTEEPESDGTLAWDSVTLVLVQVDAGGETGIGYTYADQSAATLVSSKLAGLVLGVGLADLLGRAHEAAPIYGSGGLTSSSDRELREQFEGWVRRGIPRVKMKIGRDPEADPQRVRVARQAIGPDTELYVDANGAYQRKQALAQAQWLREQAVCWFEEPVSSNDLEGLHLLRDQGPPGMAIAAGEYGYEPGYFRRMLEAGAVDVLQADATRCCGIAGCSVPPLMHCEYFHTHARVEGLLFDGVLDPVDGMLRPDPSRPGLGLELKRGETKRFAL